MHACGGAPRACWQGFKRLFPGGGAKGFVVLCDKRLFSSGMAQKDRALDRPRRRQKASGRVVTCPGRLMALKRKPRNRALFALWCIWPICKIEAGLRQV